MSCVLTWACQQHEAPSPRCLTDQQRVATGWDAAEELFRRDLTWRGADSAYSVDLGGGRVLWLFGDSFISPTGNGSRAGAPFAHNSLAIQHGYDPTSASIDFHFQRAADGTIGSFFPSDTPDTQLWVGDGARLGSVLLVFLSRIKFTGTAAFDFAADIPEARLIANPDDDPSLWSITPVSVPTNPWNVFLSEGAVFVENGWLYAFSPVDPGNHDVYVARWPVADAAAGNLGNPEWMFAPDAWAYQSVMTEPPMRVFDHGHTEFTVFFDQLSGQYVQIQATGFPGDIMMRTAAVLTGPWSPQQVVYHPPESDCPGIIAYAGKAHPELTATALDGRVALTYASNYLDDFAALVSDLNIYFPRFIRLEVNAGVATP